MIALLLAAATALPMAHLKVTQRWHSAKGRPSSADAEVWMSDRRWHVRDASGDRFGDDGTRSRPTVLDALLGGTPAHAQRGATTTVAGAECATYSWAKHVMHTSIFGSRCIHGRLALRGAEWSKDRGHPANERGSSFEVTFLEEGPVDPKLLEPPR